MVSNNICPDIHGQLYLLTSDLITVWIFLNTNVAFSFVINSIDGKRDLRPVAREVKWVESTHYGFAQYQRQTYVSAC